VCSKAVSVVHTCNNQYDRTSSSTISHSTMVTGDHDVHEKRTIVPRKHDSRATSARPPVSSLYLNNSSHVIRSSVSTASLIDGLVLISRNT
jgi:hypothetical protein